MPTAVALTRLDTLKKDGGPDISIEDGQLMLAGRIPSDITQEFGSPLYIYSERILRARCREVASFLKYKPFTPLYSCKANSNVALLKIVREEGLSADAMSPGEITLLKAAGFEPNQILYVGNNVDDDEMTFAIQAGVKVSVDSLAQLERYGRLNPGGKVTVRINPGIGDGHHKKVVTGGADAKFGVYYTDINQVKAIAKAHNLKVDGVNQHIGSNFLAGDTYLASVKKLLSIAEQLEDLSFVDFGGGFGVPYKNDATRLDLATLGDQVSEELEKWTTRYGKRITAQCEPGRYIPCESGILLITVHSIKENPGYLFVGTDGGFNVLQRPVMYGSHHEIINTRIATAHPDTMLATNICGNICESGDLLCEDRPLPPAQEGDILAVLDAGAYGQSMSSNYNARLRPAEVLMTRDGGIKVIRERDTLEDILRHQIY